MVGVTSKVTVLENKDRTRGGGHRRSHLSWKRIVQHVIGVTSEVTCLGKKPVQLVVGVTGEVACFGKKTRVQPVGGSHQRSHCLGKKMVQPVVEATGKVTVSEKKWSTRGRSHQRSQMSSTKWSNPEEKKKPNRGGSQQRGHCLGKKMAQPVVGVNSEVTVLGPLKRFHILSDQLTKSIVSAHFWFVLPEW